MKQFQRLAVLLLVLSVFMVGCQASLSEAEEAELNAALRDNGHAADYDCYYGTYNGYAVVMCAGNLDVYQTIAIVDYSFEFGNNFYLYAYKDGVICNLKDVYEEGLLTQAQIGEIYDRHVAYTEKQ